MSESESASSAAIAESAARRLREALEKIAAGTLDECPVCLDKPAPADARVLRCCQAIMCKDCIPSCKRTCPFCRLPFQERIELDEKREDVYESPYTYSTHDYSVHTEFVVSVDYTVSRRDWYETSGSSSSNPVAGASSSGGSSNGFSYTTKDYSVASSSYTTKDYSAKDYSSSTNYSVAADKYTASSSDYSDIAKKYSSS